MNSKGINNKVAQVIPYFGKWPEWIELYMYSCGRNDMVDFIFYTDCEIPEHNYPNTIFHKCSFEDYQHLVSERLNIEYKIKSAYKLTDLKPFLGAIHERELLGYDFWGFGDIDLVYGDLSMVVNDKHLKRYDVITTHNYHIAGHFTLVRNNEKYRTLCFGIKNWEKGLVEDKHHGYDEAEWSGLVFPGLRYIRALHGKILKHFKIHLFTVLDALNPIFAPRLLFREYWTSPNPTPLGTHMIPQWIYEVNKGQLKCSDGGSIPYLHFLFFKKTPWLETDYYWREGYFQLNNNIQKYKLIKFDCFSITGEL